MFLKVSDCENDDWLAIYHSHCPFWFEAMLNGGCTGYWI